MSTLIAVSALDGCFNGDIIMLMLHTVKSVLYVYTVHLFLIYDTVLIMILYERKRV